MKSDKLKSIEKQIAKLESQRHAESLKCIKKGLKQLFVDFEDLESIGWRQYTPYWNDGDTCDFTVYNDDPDINGEEVSEWHLKTTLEQVKNEANFLEAIKELEEQVDQYKDNEWHSTDQYVERITDLRDLYASKKDQARLKYELKRLLAIKKVLDSISEDEYLNIFGDHVQVLVTKDGWRTERAEHG